jgi:hypothetical protein
MSSMMPEYVVGDMDHDAALDRWNDEIGNAEYSVREIVVNVPEVKTTEVTMSSSDADLAVA